MSKALNFHATSRMLANRGTIKIGGLRLVEISPFPDFRNRARMHRYSIAWRTTSSKVTGKAKVKSLERWWMWQQIGTEKCRSLNRWKWKMIIPQHDHHPNRNNHESSAAILGSLLGAKKQKSQLYWWQGLAKNQSTLLLLLLFPEKKMHRHGRILNQKKDVWSTGPTAAFYAGMESIIISKVEFSWYSCGLLWIKLPTLPGSIFSVNSSWWCTYGFALHFRSECIQRRFPHAIGARSSWCSIRCLVLINQFFDHLEIVARLL